MISVILESKFKDELKFLKTFKAFVIYLNNLYAKVMKILQIYRSESTKTETIYFFSLKN